MVYRHIFFKKNILRQGLGNVEVQYYGNMYANATTLKNFKEMYDRSKDLYIQCNDCAAHKYGKFTKVQYGT